MGRNSSSTTDDGKLKIGTTNHNLEALLRLLLERRPIVVTTWNMQESHQ
jgi:hypothetical protein